ncbi:PREDICTED: uncharacterized protein LOC108568723 [Nicrophorus vespilloides]|uniref:Uncharacterized protein LOC108568723 n=1 Tax=Nicrophorus vespilloides TaxID=110193 RepID=A0ABM1NF48_NICVS|nr:PREDICTED: uncharacterized protein LOC108568723 [Nicrophorus vespilloides]
MSYPSQDFCDFLEDYECIAHDFRAVKLFKEKQFRLDDCRIIKFGFSLQSFKEFLEALSNIIMVNGSDPIILEQHRIDVFDNYVQLSYASNARSAIHLGLEATGKLKIFGGWISSMNDYNFIDILDTLMDYVVNKMKDGVQLNQALIISAIERVIDSGIRSDLYELLLNFNEYLVKEIKNKIFNQSQYLSFYEFN